MTIFILINLENIIKLQFSCNYRKKLLIEDYGLVELSLLIGIFVSLGGSRSISAHRLSVRPAAIWHQGRPLFVRKSGMC